MNTQKILAALFYATASSLITILNKIVLTTYKFPSYQLLFIGQQWAAIILLQLGKRTKLINFPSLSQISISKLFPLPLLFALNGTTGLGGTQAVSLPMFTVLRRFSILLTMFGEYLILGIQPSNLVQMSVYSMMIGAVMASINDLSFNSTGYLLLLLNNVLTALSGVFTKEKLIESKHIGKYGLLYYNSLLTILPATLIAYFSGEFDKIQEDPNSQLWFNFTFLFYFASSCILGCVLNTSMVLCTHYNSALTTSIIGCLKNVVVTYIGMFVGGDYIYSLSNFVGINISIFGSFLYTYLMLWPREELTLRLKSKSESNR